MYKTGTSTIAQEVLSMQINPVLNVICVNCALNRNPLSITIGARIQD